MKKIIIGLLLFSVFVIKSYNQSYNPKIIYTKTSYAVTVMSLGSNDMTTHVKDSIKIAMLEYYDNRIIFINEATYSYNCHAYAWYMSEQNINDRVWLDSPAEFINREGYVLKDRDDATKVTFDDIFHSANLTNQLGVLESKWGAGPLFRHTVQDCPYFYMTPKYYANSNASSPYKVEITSPPPPYPGTFTPGDQLHFSAALTSSGNALTYDWTITLYYAGSSYQYAQQSFSTNSGTCSWNPYTSATLPSYNWLKDENGNIMGEVKVIVHTSDNKTYEDKIRISAYTPCTVQITNPTPPYPVIFTAGDQVHCSAELTGTANPVSYDWVIYLHHPDGSYEYARQDNCPDIGNACNWDPVTSTTLPNYNWYKDANGNIQGQIIVTAHSGSRQLAENTVYIYVAPFSVKVQIIDPPPPLAANSIMFTYGDQVNYYAGFTSITVTALSYDWTLSLYLSGGGSYVYAQQNNCPDIGNACYWVSSTSPMLPSSGWLKDSNGNIMGNVKVIVHTSDNHSYEDNISIGVSDDCVSSIINKTYITNAKFNGCSSGLTIQNVQVQDNARVLIYPGGNTIITPPLEVKSGASFNIDFH